MTCNQTRTPAEWHWWHSERAIHDLCVIRYSIVKNPFTNIRSYKNSLPQIHAYIAYPNLFSTIVLYFNRDYLSWCVFNRFYPWNDWLLRFYFDFFGPLFCHFKRFSLITELIGNEIFEMWTGHWRLIVSCLWVSMRIIGNIYYSIHRGVNGSRIFLIWMIFWRILWWYHVNCRRKTYYWFLSVDKKKQSVIWRFAQADGVNVIWNY